jgi:Cytochrome c
VKASRITWIRFRRTRWSDDPSVRKSAVNGRQIRVRGYVDRWRPCRKRYCDLYPSPVDPRSSDANRDFGGTSGFPKIPYLCCMMSTRSCYARGVDRGLRSALAIAILTLSASCSSSTSREPVSDVALQTFEQRCAVCHGASGDGRVQRGPGLPVAVPDWTDTRRQSQISDEEIRAVIVGGGPAGGKSVAMPPHPDLAETQTLDEIVTLIRNFGE